MKQKPNIGIIDTGTSNIKSVIYACKANDIEISIITNKFKCKDLDGLILPGIGSFGVVMENIRKNRLEDSILEFLHLCKPAFFICVGFQILFSDSEEFGSQKGLGFLEGSVKKIPENNFRKVPIIGWNAINLNHESKLFKNTNNNLNFYFTHSFYVQPKDKNIISSTSNYYDFKYCSSIENKNLFATQFHPEKSSKSGLEIYKNFKNICLD